MGKVLNGLSIISFIVSYIYLIVKQCALAVITTVALRQLYIMCPLCMSFLKLIVMITGWAHCFMIAYMLCPSCFVGFEHSVCRRSLMTTYAEKKNNYKNK